MDQAELHAGRQKRQDALARVNARHLDDVVSREAWSVKDLLAQIAFWEQRAASPYHVEAAARTLGEMATFAGAGASTRAASE